MRPTERGTKRHLLNIANLVCRGYNLTYMIAYIRDFAFQVGLISESFETSVPWSECAVLCRRVKERVRKTSRLLKVPGEPFFSCRVTQVYYCFHTAEIYVTNIADL